MDCIKENNCLIVFVRGKLDAVTAPDFEREMSGVTSAGEKNILLECASLEYISSAGLRSILRLAKTARQMQGRLLFCCLNGYVKEVFRMSGFSSVLEICDTREDALARF